MTGLIATGLAVAVIATLMVIGIKMKLPPPDPNWREHLLPPPPRPTGAWIFLMFGPRVGFYLVVVAAVVAALLHADGARTVLGVIAALSILARVIATFGWSAHVRKYRRDLHRDPSSARNPT